MNDLPGPESVAERARRYPTAVTGEQLVRNLSAVQAAVQSAANRAGRADAPIRVLPVSKTVGDQRVRLAVEAGFTELGENRVQEAMRKREALGDLDVSWAIIGHLQSNKAREVAAWASEFHALDRMRVAQALDRRLTAAGRRLDVYVQVNTSAEDSKFGLPPHELPEFLREVARLDTLRVRGLMTLALFTSDVTRVRECFVLLRTLRDRMREDDPDLIGPGELSMGMSGDYEVAVEEGADVVRVGQAVFGARATPDHLYWPTAAGEERA